MPELHDRLREYEDRLHRVFTEAFAGELSLPPSDLRPQMLASAVLGAFEAVRGCWLDGLRIGDDQTFPA